ncbi:putative GMP synthase [Daphnia magna]|uniref:Putative GMP synthase n=1 Tax=Daphnia magna TaxID=35525 RepID=A0A164URD1_9CRUS|nr:putative GMP synthase [Daphnia magna]
MTEFFYRQLSKQVCLSTMPPPTCMVAKLCCCDGHRVVQPLEDFHKDEVRALCRELDPPTKLLERHPFPGPGLSIQIIYAEEPFLEADFDETQVLIRLMVHYM